MPIKDDTAEFTPMMPSDERQNRVNQLAQLSSRPELNRRFNVFCQRCRQWLHSRERFTLGPENLETLEAARLALKQEVRT